MRRLWVVPLRFCSSSAAVRRPAALNYDHSPRGLNADQILIDNFGEYCNRGDINRAMIALNSMQERKVFADAVTYSQLIKCCVAHRAVHHATTLHRHVFSHGYRPKTFLLNNLVSMYIRFGMLQEAQQLFDQMPERNVVSWTSMISAYASSSSSADLKHRAVEYLVLMLRDGVLPNMFTYSSILRACPNKHILKQIHSGILKVGLESDVFVRSALIDVYSRWGDMRNAMAVFKEMMTGDQVVWNSIIGGFAQNSQGEEAVELYKEMKRRGFQAEESTLTSVLRGCTGLALLELGTQLHVHVLKYDHDLILNNGLLDMYCKCGSLTDAEVIFRHMSHKDVISWSTMIIGLAQNGFSRRALELFEEMKSTKIKPNNITILGVLFACSHAGMVDVGEHYFHSMKKLFGVSPEREHYGCMVDLLGRAGKLDEAVKLIHEMHCEPDGVTWRALLGACRVHRNMDLAAYAAKQVLKHDPNDPGTYILLSNIYANTQKWDELAQVRNAMKDIGVTKEPGCSWIEVDRSIHAFIMGDDSHPRSSEIRRELKQIIQRLKEEGYVPDINFVLQDLEGEQMEDSLIYHSEKMAIVFGLMNLSPGKTIRIRKNLRICGDCHMFAKLLAKMECRSIVIRDPIRYHHFQDGSCSCGDYW